MKRLFWKWIAPTAVACAAIAILCLAAYPHCFVRAKNRSVQIDGVSVNGAAVFSNGSSWNELVLLPNRSGDVVYSADLQGEVAGALNKREVVKLPGVLFVRGADRFDKLLEKEIYDPSLKPGEAPQRFHFITEDKRRVDVSLNYPRHATEWHPLMRVLLLGSLTLGVLLAPPLFLGGGWWAQTRDSNPNAGWRGRLLLYVLFFATLSWLGFVATAVTDAFLQRDYRVALVNYQFVKSIWTTEIWVGVLGCTACILAGLVGRGLARRSAVYASVTLLLMWFFVAVVP
jgi:hypothetical protein